MYKTCARIQGEGESETCSTFQNSCADRSTRCALAVRAGGPQELYLGDVSTAGRRSLSCVQVPDQSMPLENPGRPRGDKLAYSLTSVLPPPSAGAEPVSPKRGNLGFGKPALSQAGDECAPPAWLQWAAPVSQMILQNIG